MTEKQRAELTQRVLVALTPILERREAGLRAEVERLGLADCELVALSNANAMKLKSAEQQLTEARADSTRLLNVARGCFDYSGGHRDKDRETFHHGIQTVVNALEAAMKRDPNDTQVNALERIGNTALARKEGAT